MLQYWSSWARSPFRVSILFFIFSVFFLIFIDSIEASEQGARVECLEPPGQCPCLQLREFFLCFCRSLWGRREYPSGSNSRASAPVFKFFFILIECLSSPCECPCYKFVGHRQTDRRTDRHIGRQTDRHSHTHHWHIAGTDTVGLWFCLSLCFSIFYFLFLFCLSLCARARKHTHTHTHTTHTHTVCESFCLSAHTFAYTHTQTRTPTHTPTHTHTYASRASYLR